MSGVLKLETVQKFYIAEGRDDADWITGAYEFIMEQASLLAEMKEPDDENDILNLYEHFPNSFRDTDLEDYLRGNGVEKESFFAA